MSDRTESWDDAKYAALTDETRLRILFALANRYDEAWSSGWLTFSELRERVGTEDTSRFSYHLGELQEEFVRKEDGRYRPTVAALTVVAAIRSGTYGDGEVSVEDRRTDYDCPRCDEALVASYENHHLYVGCRTHGAAVAYPTPPRAVADRTVEEVIDLSLRKHACDVRLLRKGVCPHCWGAAGLSFPRESVPDSYLLDDVPYATAACEACWVSYPIPTAHTVLGHPAVETLYAEYGLGPAAAQVGPHALAKVSEVVEAEVGPVAAQVIVELGDRAVVLELDEACDVLGYRRR